MAETPIGEVILKNVRLSFFHGFKPAPVKTNSDGTTRGGNFQASFLMERGTPDGDRNIKKIQKAAALVKEDKWGKKQPKLKPNQVCLRNGDLEDYEGYEGCNFVSTNRRVEDGPPQIVGRDREAVEPGDKQAPYSGCYVNAVVRVWAQDNDHGKRINASLEAVQFLRHGEAFSGAAPVDPNEKFEDLSDDEDDLDPIGDPDDDDDGDDEGASLI